jgi:hypothetical protein
MKECVGPKEEESRLNDAGTFTARPDSPRGKPFNQIGKLGNFSSIKPS